MADAAEGLTAAALVAVGGFVGAASRFALDALAVTLAGTVLPVPPGTLTVNVLGSFALGVLSLALRRPRVRLLLTTGALSSFTTYSTFAAETASLGPVAGALNVVATYALGFLAAAAGLALGRRVRARRGATTTRSSGGERR